MSRATIEQSINSLVPTLNGILPGELLELALALLALSRSVAHSLKPDEEIARPYACAQLACERLKKRLNLPAITSRPPCPPRIYKKLYKYLESVLPTAAPREPQTPRKSKTASAPPSGRTTPKTPASAKRTPRTMTRKEDHTAQDCPEWVMPAVRAIVKAFSCPNAAPHIYAGVASILPLLERMAAAAPDTPSKRPRCAAATTLSTEISECRILGLIAVVLFYVLSRILNRHITPGLVMEWQNKASSTLATLPNVQNIQPPMIEAEIESLLPMAQEEGWLQMEWFSNVVAVDDGEEMDGLATAGTSKPNTTYIGEFRSGGSDYIGLGTMMQDATDYLGVRQREEYQVWKSAIMARVEEIEASQS